MSVEHELVLLAGNSNPPLAKETARSLDCDVYNPISYFADGEIRINPHPETLEGKDIFIIQSTSRSSLVSDEGRLLKFSVNDMIMELRLMIETAKGAAAHRITGVISYFGYARQDRPEQPEVPISSASVLNILIEAGLDRLVTVDIHSEQQKGFARLLRWDNLYGSDELMPVIRGYGLSNQVFVSPDVGGAKRTKAYNELLEGDGIALIYKERDLKQSNHSRAVDIIGNVQGKNVWIVDDILDTGGTDVDATTLLLEKGALSVRAAIAHGLFSGNAIERINASKIEKVLVLNTVLHTPEIIDNPKIKVVTVGPLLAKTIRRIHDGRPLKPDLIK